MATSRNTPPSFPYLSLSPRTLADHVIFDTFSAHTLSPDELYRAHLTPYLQETQTTLDSKIESTQSENAELAQRVQAQRIEIESLLSGLESVVADLEGAAAAATQYCDDNDLRKEAVQMDGEVKARSDI